VDGEQVTWTNNTSIDQWRKLGVAPLQGEAIATVHDGKIVAFSVALTPESMQRLQQAMANAPAMPNTGAGGTSDPAIPDSELGNGIFTYSVVAAGHHLLGMRECEQDDCAVVSIGNVAGRMRGTQTVDRQPLASTDRRLAPSFTR
jgi:hypothetical protein